VLVTGRTGSGKTTTLYAILNELNDSTRKINTLEDPVECYIPGIYQTQVNPRQDQDFADLLPALLRHAPDVVMVGEIRDVETAKIALQAAAAGQAVFATLHASNAARAVHSMLQLNANPHVLAGALRGVIAQDLLRRVCTFCAEPVDVEDDGSFIKTDELARWLPADFSPQLKRRRACARCENLGFHGQVGIFELLLCSAPIRGLIRQEASPESIEAKAVDEGFIPLRVCAQLAVVKGLTTMEEALPVLNDVPTLGCQSGQTETQQGQHDQADGQI
jgi:type II secretory ATPase GspE/PulE/Tfp pilus assembly ATPase PilB-like protein